MFKMVSKINGNRFKVLPSMRNKIWTSTQEVGAVNIILLQSYANT